MLLGAFSDLDQVVSVVIDRAGYLCYIPDEPQHTHISEQVYSGIWEFILILELYRSEGFKPSAYTSLRKTSHQR
jgi:hypothetical protein